MRRSILDDITSSITSGSRGWAKYYSEKGSLFLRMTNLPKSGIKLMLSDMKYVKLPSEGKEGIRTRVFEGDILISITAELGKIGYVKTSVGEAYVNQHVALVRVDDDEICSEYLAYLLSSAPERNRLNRLNDAGAKAGLSLKTLQKFPLFLPPLPEQKAIADVLSTWDQAIEKTQQLIKAKEKQFEYMLHKLIRSPEADQNTVELGQICNPISRKNTVSETNVLTSSAEHGLVAQDTYYKKSVAGKNLAAYYLLRRGDFAYNRSSSKGYPYGAIKRLDLHEQGLLSTLYLCFELHDKKHCDADYLLFLFESGLINKQLREICQEGARSHGLLNLAKADFYKVKISLPEIKEQKKIVADLTAASDEVILLKKLLTQYQTQKRGLMQRLLTGEWRVKF